MRQHLIIDADDTLWENNIYFERAFDEFVGFLAHSTLPPTDVRAVLDEIEHANARIHGYGSQSFGRNLRQCYERLAERAIGEEDLVTVMGFAERILGRPIELIDGDWLRDTRRVSARARPPEPAQRVRSRESRERAPGQGLGRSEVPHARFGPAGGASAAHDRPDRLVLPRKTLTADESRRFLSVPLLIHFTDLLQ